MVTEAEKIAQQAFEGYELTVWGLIGEKIGSIREVPTGSIAEQVLSDVWAMMEAGSEWARGVIWSAAKVGFREKVRQYKKREKMTIHSEDGDLTIPAYVGVKLAKSGKRGRYQLCLWTELEWEDFYTMSNDSLEQGEIINTNNIIYSAVRLLRPRYPESRTVDEAFILAGIDPQNFSLEEITG